MGPRSTARYDRNPSVAIALSPEQRRRIASSLSEVFNSPLANNETGWTALSGGFRNANFRVDIEGRSYVVRVIASGRGIAQKEALLLPALQAQGIAVPPFVQLLEEEEQAIVVIEFVGGELLEDALASDSCLGERLWFDVGRRLARVHQTAVPEPVLPALFEGMPSAETFCHEAYEVIAQSLRGIAGERLGTRVAAAVQKLIDSHWDIVESTYRPGLAHADYNSKNVLVDRDSEKVTAILDWAFAFFGHQLVDLGNFLRFEDEDYSPAAVEAFLAGYRNAGGELLPGWRQAALLLDLVSMAQFLSREGDLPRTFATARAVVERTLRLF